MKISLGFLKPKQRSTPPGLCLLTDAAGSEAILRQWQEELLTRLTADADAPTPDARPQGGERHEA